jgi:tetratricopeptide (TPR) repeat protein
MAPHNNMAANDFAKELGLRGNYQAAIPIFLQVIERKPSYWLPNFNIGVAYYQIGNLPKAEYYFRQAIKIYPSDAAGLRFLGFTLLELGRIDEAASVLRRAISLDSSAPDQHYALGTILKQQKDFAGALKEFKVEQNINPNRPDLQRDMTETESQLTANPE